jgi:hypothetical protein
MGDLCLLVGEMLAAGELQQRVELCRVLATHLFDLGSVEQGYPAGLGTMRLLAP